VFHEALVCLTVQRKDIILKTEDWDVLLPLLQWQNESDVDLEDLFQEMKKNSFSKFFSSFEEMREKEIEKIRQINQEANRPYTPIQDEGVWEEGGVVCGIERRRVFRDSSNKNEDVGKNIKPAN